MANNKLEKIVIQYLRNALGFLFSRRSIPMLKGTLAYILTFVLIFLRRFDELSQYPLALASAMIVVIANGPGKSVGACVQATILSMAGVSLGCVGFLVLAKLSPWPIAQAFVFAIIVYAMALVKARSPRWFGFTLLCILNSFNGIYTSYMLGSIYSPKLLKGYYTSYLWGAAIVLGVNFLVFPYSSEKELRRTLVASLEHIGTFAHLLAKGYTLEISEEEFALRDHLSQTIRADFGFLSQKIEETTIEINYSRFSMKAYQSFVSRTRALQQALITAHSSLVGVSSEDYELFRERFLPSTVVAFNHLRRAVDLTIRDIGNELGCTPMVIPATQDTYNCYMEAEAQVPREALASQLALVSEKLAAEVEGGTIPPSPRVGTSEGGTPSQFPSTSSAPASTLSKTNKRMAGRPESQYGIQRLRREFDTYAAAQHTMLQEALVSGHLQGATDGDLRMHRPRASLKDFYGMSNVPRDTDEGDVARPVTTKAGHRPTEFATEKESTEQEKSESAETALRSGHSLIRVWGFLYALEQFVSELEALSESIKPDGIQPRKRLHVHLFEALHRPHARSTAEENDLSLAEALALLENRVYVPVRRNFWQHLEHCTQVIQNPASVFAAKTAAATTVFGLLIYANSPRPWFINYGLSSGMLTIVVALAPTLGQSMMTFLFQIAGSGIGYLWSLAVLEMFRNVGGYTFNPYGIICMISPFALILQYLLYNVPKYFVVALLGLNGCGVVVVTEWIAVEYLHRKNFDNPAFRAAKGLTALTIALAIVAIFQLFILRNPARRTLRKQVASLTFDTLSYTVLLQAFGRSVLALDPQCRSPMPALLRVERELRHRELKIQSKIINTLPLLTFAAAEPQFARPFRKASFSSLIQSNQIILDRLREARAALGTQPFEDFILTNFVSELAPYRVRNTRTIKAQLYVVASSLQSKAPLPHDTPLCLVNQGYRGDFVHDMLVLSSRFAKTEEGNRSIRSREFMRYISYLLGWTALYDALQAMEDASKQLFGELESKLL